jgi:hypothetical protein
MSKNLEILIVLGLFKNLAEKFNIFLCSSVISISIATGLYGVSFGALSVTSGLDFWQTMALSLLLFSGGSQFAFIGVVAGGDYELGGIASEQKRISYAWRCRQNAGCH